MKAKSMKKDFIQITNKKSYAGEGKLKNSLFILDMIN